MQVRHATAPDQVAGMDTEALRRRFLVTEMFAPGEVRLAYSHEDRIVVGGAGGLGPVDADSRRAARRALPGAARTGRGQRRRPRHGHRRRRRVRAGAQGVPVRRPRRARGRLRRTSGVLPGLGPRPHHLPHRAGHPGDAEPVGSATRRASNDRTIDKYIHADGVQSCQLVLGVTVLDPGSMWNTMPCHTHERRTEVYLYFGLPRGDRVVHLWDGPRRPGTSSSPTGRP